MWRMILMAAFAAAVECRAAFVSDAEYLDLVEAAVSAYSDEHVAEYVADADANGVNEHGFPRLAANLGALVAAGRMTGRRGLYRRMMDICCRDAKKGCMKKEGNEFSVKELVATLLEVEKAGLFPKSVTDAWRRDIAAIDPWRCYRCQPEPGNTKRSFNWVVFGTASEQTRIAAGMGGDAAFVARYVPDQMRWFDENGMWREPHEPFVYDLVTRLQFALILSAGYAGPSRDALSAHLDRGAAATLAMQSVSGEIPYGGRSNQFLHNDTLYAALCEWYAARFRARGDLKMAARFRLAAAHAVEGLRRWLAERPVRHVKNRYPTGTGKRGTGIGCESYAYFDKYMVTMGSWAIVARRFADHSPLPEVREPETMAFEPAPHFHVVCLRAGDYTAQFDYNAQAEYDCDGLGRVHRRGAPSAICMSVPCPAGERIGYSTEAPNARTLAIAPVGDGALRPDWSGADAEGAWANWKQGALDWKCRLTRKGVESVLAGPGEVTMSLPAFEFDGETATVISCDGKTLAIRYRGWICTYTADGAVADTGTVCCNRNGRYRAFEARGAGRLTVRVSIEKEEGTR